MIRYFPDRDAAIAYAWDGESIYVATRSEGLRMTCEWATVPDGEEADLYELMPGSEWVMRKGSRGIESSYARETS